MIMFENCGARSKILNHYTSHFQVVIHWQTIFSTLGKDSKNIFDFCKFVKQKVFSTLANSSEGVGRSVRPPAHGRHAVHHVRQAAGQLHQVQGDLISLSTCSLLTESCLSGLEPHRRDPWQDQRDTGKQGHPSNCCQHQGNDNAITKNTERRKIKRSNCKPWPTRGAKWLRGKQARRSRKRFPQGTTTGFFFAPYQILLYVF